MDKAIFGRALMVLVLITRIVASPASTRISLTQLEKEWEKRIICPTESCLSAADSILSSINATVDPCVNFYEYACGNWAAQHPIPNSYSEWSQIEILSTEIIKRIRGIIESPVDENDIAAMKKAKLAFQTCMDEQTIENDGLDEIKAILRDNGGWPLAMPPGMWLEGKVSWQKLETDYIRRDISFTMFNIYVSYDSRSKNTRNIIQITKPTTFDLETSKLIGLERDQNLMDIYTKYIATMVRAVHVSKELKGFETELINSIQDMIKFEIRLANITTLNSTTDALNNTMTIAELQKISDSAGPRTSTAKLNWLEILQNVFADIPKITITDREEVYFLDKNYLIKVVQLLNETPEETVVNYAHWKMVTTLVYHTTNEMRQNKENFWNATTGSTHAKSRDHYCRDQIGFEHAISYVFVRSFFSKYSKKTALDVVKSIQDALAEEIEKSTWLDTRTKALAKGKLARVQRLIGYPDWYNADAINNFYEDLPVGHLYMKNHLSNLKFNVEQSHKELRNPVNRSKWPVSPSQMNAFYYRTNNAIIMPAAILQPPIFDNDVSPFVNYASTGMIIGHEISHGFDTWEKQNNDMDENNQWLSDDGLNKYNNLTQCFVDQFDNYIIYASTNKTIHADGKKTLRENIADTTGFRVAYEAYTQWKKENDVFFTLPGFDNYTNDQLFFLAQANTWCGTQSDEALQNGPSKDVHSINSLRVIGSLSNLDGFGQAFNCPVGSVMNPVKKCNIWS